MLLQNIPALEAGTNLVLRPTSDGLQVHLHRAAGYEFAGDADVTGFVQDSRASLRALSRMDMPRVWFRTWLGLISLQQYTTSWALRVTHADLAEACQVARPHLSEPLAYFTGIGWVRDVRRGTRQLNPWLTHCGTSAAQAAAQQAWLEAGAREFIIPCSTHPAQWRAERRAAATQTPHGAQLALVTEDSPTERGAAITYVPHRRRPGSADGAGAPLPTTVTGLVRAAFADADCGSDAPTHRIQEWIAARGATVNPATLKSAISRERARRTAS
ncbi:hypothetical protein [Actinomadura sp. 3N407]|uniref:hypothetical protein n=1 Tax=Actinomadura sp. 3N407 TaxID=3457423 RepID=UPI003FCD4515